MRYFVTFEQKEPPNHFSSFTIDSDSYTRALAIAKAECMKFGLRFIRLAPAAAGQVEVSLYQALEYQESPGKARLEPDDIDALIEMALQKKDEEWFTRLMQRRREGSKGP